MAVKKTLKEIIRDEYKKCSQDPVHFMRKYCIIQHPTKGKMYFNLYPFQEDSLTKISENRYSVILKSRQLGISTLTAGYALWRMIFKEDFNVLVIATKQDVAKNLVTKVRVMHDNLLSSIVFPFNQLGKPSCMILTFVTRFFATSCFVAITKTFLSR